MLRIKKSFITHTTQNYEEVTINLVNSIKEFSKYNIIVYTISYEASNKLKSMTKCIRLDINLPNINNTDFKLDDNGNTYVNRNTYRTYKVLSSKVDCMLHACDYIEEWVYLDGDSIANYNVDDLFDFCKKSKEYPLASRGPHEYMILIRNGIKLGNPFDENNNKDNTKCLEWPLMNYLKIPLDKRSRYRTTNILTGNNNNKDFLNKWKSYKENLPNKLDINKFMPFHEETIYNVLVWNIEQNKDIDLVYINIEGLKTVKHFFKTTESDKIISDFYKLPKEKSQIKVFHGEKRKKEVDNIIKEIKKQNIPKSNSSKWYEIKNKDVPTLFVYKTIKKTRVEFWNTNSLVYSKSSLKEGHWYKPNKNISSIWTVKIWIGDKLIHKENINKILLCENRDEVMPRLLNEIEAKEVVEVGVFKGEFSKKILENWSGNLWMIDPWRPFEEKEGYIDASNHKIHKTAYSESIKNIKGFENRAFMLRGLSSDMVNRFENRSLDMVYIDGNHAYDWVKEDIELWWPKVKPGGILAGHDYLDMDWQSGSFLENKKDKHIYMKADSETDYIYAGVFGVNPAVDEFINKNNLTFYLTKEWLGTWIIKKN